jgi:hypothetical protein
VFAVDSRLDVVAHISSSRRLHQTCVRIGERSLRVAALFHLGELLLMFPQAFFYPLDLLL